MDGTQGIDSLENPFQGEGVVSEVFTVSAPHPAGSVSGAEQQPA
jgi:hypothetical protein